MVRHLAAEKGFVHAKTMITDKKLSIVGTANMDIRSFDLNFEVNALIYDDDFAAEMREVFFEDLKHSKIKIIRTFDLILTTFPCNNYSTNLILRIQ